MAVETKPSASSPTSSLVYSFRDTLNSIQDGTLACGSNSNEPHTVAYKTRSSSKKPRNGSNSLLKKLSGCASEIGDLSGVQEALGKAVDGNDCAGDEENQKKTASRDGSFLNKLAGYTSEVGTEVQEALGKAVKTNRCAMDLTRNGLDCRGGGSELSLGGENSIDENNDEDYQMQRLGSWGTFGTLDTIDSIQTADDLTAVLDDDGNMIDPKVLVKHKKLRERLQPKRERSVKFAYPPITSLKQCPRADPNDLPSLFFSEEELDQYEADRRSTYIVDDVEIVAVSTSLSSDDSGRNERSSIASAFKDILSTPRRNKTDHESRARSVTRKKGTPPTRPPGGEDKRLIRSVQIFLRERSTGP